MPQSLLDLARKQLTVMAEVTLQRVTVDDYPVLVAFARDAISEVLAICMHLISKVGYHDRDLRQYRLEFSRQPIDCVDNQRLELVKLRSFRHASNDREPSAPSSPQLIAAVLGAWPSGAQLASTSTNSCSTLPGEMIIRPRRASEPAFQTV